MSRPKIIATVFPGVDRWTCRLSDNCDRQAMVYLRLQGRPDLIPACDRCARSVASKTRVVDTGAADDYTDPSRNTGGSHGTH